MHCIIYIGLALVGVSTTFKKEKDLPNMSWPGKGFVHSVKKRKNMLLLK